MKALKTKTKTKTKTKKRTSKAVLASSCMSTKVAAIDLDGTLLDEQKQISPENAQAVRSLIAHGFTIVLTTGRVYQHTLPYYSQLGLNAPIVTSDGASVRIPGHKTMLDVAMDAQVVITILTAAAAQSITALSFRKDGIRVTSQHAWNDNIDRHRRELPKNYGHSAIGTVVRSRVHKILLFADAERLHAFEANLPANVNGQINRIRNPETLEFTAHGVDKVSGLACLYGPEQVTFFGDGNNDVNVLRWASLGVAMHHGSDAARAAAKMIAPPSSPGSNFAAAVEAILFQ